MIRAEVEPKTGDMALVQFPDIRGLQPVPLFRERAGRAAKAKGRLKERRERETKDELSGGRRGGKG